MAPIDNMRRVLPAHKLGAVRSGRFLGQADHPNQPFHSSCAFGPKANAEAKHPRTTSDPSGFALHLARFPATITMFQRPGSRCKKGSLMLRTIYSISMLIGLGGVATADEPQPRLPRDNL